MSAVPKPQYSELRSARSPLRVVPDVPSNLFQGNAQPIPISAPNPLAPRQRRQQAAVVESFPKPRSQPKWLQALFTVQQATTVAAWGLGVTVLGLYGWTVYSQQVWSQNYERLSRLQRSEEQMLSAIEGLKEQATLQAASTDLQPATPSSTIPLVSATHTATEAASGAELPNLSTPAETAEALGSADANAPSEVSHESSTSPVKAQLKAFFSGQSAQATDQTHNQTNPQPAEIRAQLPASLGY